MRFTPFDFYCYLRVAVALIITLLKMHYLLTTLDCAIVCKNRKGTTQPLASDANRTGKGLVNLECEYFLSTSFFGKISFFSFSQEINTIISFPLRENRLWGYLSSPFYIIPSSLLFLSLFTLHSFPISCFYQTVSPNT